MRTTILVSMFLLACGEKPAPAPEPEPAQPAPAPAPKLPAEPVAPAPVPSGATLKPDADGVVQLTGNDQMQYNGTRIEVTGTHVKLTLTHVGKLAKEAMGHNFVLLKPGTDPMAFAAKGIAAKATEYISDSEKGSVIAHTKQLGGGESDTIEFDLPGPGTYPFCCTFPGHVATMRGVLVASAGGEAAEGEGAAPEGAEAKGADEGADKGAEAKGTEEGEAEEAAKPTEAAE